MPEKNEKPRRVYLSTQTQQPVTQYVTFNPDSEMIRTKCARATVIDMDKRTGQFTLRANAPHYEEQLEALKKLVEMGRLTEVPTGKENSMRLMLQNGDLVKPDSDRSKKEAVIELQRELAEKSDEVSTLRNSEALKDAKIAELQELLAKKK